MQYVRPFDPSVIVPGEHGAWLLGPSDGAGVTVRLRRGGGVARPRVDKKNERFALVLEGNARLVGDDKVAVPGDALFIPAATDSAVSGDGDAVWVEIEASLNDGTSSGASPRVVPVDPSKFKGTGFTHQALLDRNTGAATMRMNVLQVQPGAGSPDWHIHAFNQVYLIQDGEMTVEIGRARLKAGRNSLVFLPAGVVHRNFNAANSVERHVTLLVPEPKQGEIFDYAITIHEHEAERMKVIPT